MYNYLSIDAIRSKMDQVMVVPELSLGPSMSTDQKSTSSNSLTSDQSSVRCLKKRKSFNDHIVQAAANKPVVKRSSTLDDFYLRDDQTMIKRDRLPPDWEQCLDLKSGKMYFLNRKTAEKSWERPKADENNEKPLLELELNISSPTSSHCSYSNFKASQKTLLPKEHKPMKADTDSRTTTKATTSGIGSNNMVALACSNCHLLVILSKSSPSCPNCKYVHYLHDQQDFKESPNPNLKPINTLSLFL
ncbi:hypothetical protein QQ045_032059 [Rhodiola kirilowii]